MRHQLCHVHHHLVPTLSGITSSTAITLSVAYMPVQDELLLLLEIDIKSVQTLTVNKVC